MSSKVLTGVDGVLGYYSWGSNDPENRLRRLNLTFVPGALAGMFVSSDARTFMEPPADWNPGTWDNKATHFAGSPQSLAGDLIREGVTGVAGHVAEPFLEAAIRPNILFPAYLSGFNLAESFYLAMPFLSWQTVVVGDPLCAPFRTRFLNAAEIDPGVDEATEYPKYFSNRRLRTISVAAYQNIRIHPDTIRLLLHAEVRLMKQDKQGARELLEEAILRDSRLVLAQMMLANMYEQDAEYDKAIERYRRVLQLFPDSPTALNNLAYALAVRKGQPMEALPLAEKAYTAGKGSPNVADTLGWVRHLAGDDAGAIGYLEEAMKSAAQNPEIHLHAAIVYAGLGKTNQASQSLARALSLDPKLAARDDVKSLQSKLTP
jgi:Tfp pilus assembly protein PilF